MSNDTELLRQYIDERSESAFTELVCQHLNLVYSAASREMSGDTALAEDLSQAVFTEMAGKAERLRNHPSLAGWLYTAVRHLAANLRRAEHRRRRREEEAHSMNTPHADEPPDLAWQRIRPTLDDALHELSEADRCAIALRFLEDRSLREVGTALGLNENAARMRVDRALEKLRNLLERRGITSTASGLATALAAGVITPAPSALAATIATSALAGGAAATTSTSLTYIKIMSAIKIKAAVVGALVIAGVAVPVWQQNKLSHVQSENAQLRVQAAELAPLQEEVGRLRKTRVDQAELERLRKWQAQTEPELLRLRGMSGVAKSAGAEVAELRAQVAQQKSEGASNGIAGPMGEMMKNMMEQRVATQLASMTKKVNLTPEQADAIKEILMRQAQAASAGMQQVLSGKLNKDEIAKLGQAGNPEEQIKALLTPEQLEAYRSYKKDEAASNARMVANSELMQMQAGLELTPEQQDRVVGVLSEFYSNQLSGSQKQTFTNQADQFEWTLEQKIKSMESILTPSQIETYRKQQEVQMKFVKDILGKMEKGSGGK